MATTFNDAVRLNGPVTLGSTVTGLTTTMLPQRDLMVYHIPWTDWRVWNTINTNLPAAAASDDLGLYGGTFGTDALHISMGDQKNAGAVTMYARTQIILPAEYVDGQTVTMRFYAGMKTTVASVSATLDVEAYLHDGEGLVDGSDLCTTAAQDINSLVFANKDFQLTATSLTAGDWIDLRITMAVNDSATGTAVDPSIGRIQLLCDTKG